MIKALPSDVAGVLDVLLRGDDLVHVALLGQMPHLYERGRCTCGCGTTFFDLDTASVQSAPSGPSTVVAAEAQFCTEGGACHGEVLVFAAVGYLSWLEVVSWGADDQKTTLAMVRQALRH
ncbi:hypothetical protein J2X68_008011 [Streptomyces sp. 3330]|uniref:hypothetical protein n=1 Tax=Streptomyces sp. 3330 TaxID=2817755 RepID=UPI002855F1D4|nr:hypothetical protein [Streptomyces sp. 3330]MDR6981268.1 hypothetical protein [Streptomyces sp. 3330]